MPAASAYVGENEFMIARIWRGWAPQERADDYQRHYETEVTNHLRAVTGFLGAQLLRHGEDGEVTFTSITWFSNLDAVRGFAGDDYERAVVEPAAQTALTRWDERVAHHEVTFDLPPSVR
jgi:heme-degrading monooxygenase HmoA